jgi:hypothetical protein
MFLMAAMREAPANRIAPTQYSQIIWAILLGALFFGEFPDATAFAGIVLVTFAGLFTFLIIWLVHALIYRWPRTRFSDEAVEVALERFSLSGLFGRRRK